MVGTIIIAVSSLKSALLLQPANHLNALAQCRALNRARAVPISHIPTLQLNINIGLFVLFASALSLTTLLDKVVDGLMPTPTVQQSVYMETTA